MIIFFFKFIIFKFNIFFIIIILPQLLFLIIVFVINFGTDYIKTTPSLFSEIVFLLICDLPPSTIKIPSYLNIKFINIFFF